MTSATVFTLMLRSGWLSSQVRNASMVRSATGRYPAMQVSYVGVPE